MIVLLYLVLSLQKEKMAHPLNLRLRLRYIYTISISWTIAHKRPQFTERYCGHRGGATTERSCIAQEAASLVKIRTACPEDKKGTVHRGGLARWYNGNRRENRWYTAARLNPIFSPPAIYEIYRRDKGSSRHLPPCSSAYSRGKRLSALCGWLYEWTIAAEVQNSTDLMRENLVWLTFECLWLHPLDVLLCDTLTASFTLVGQLHL